MKAMAHADVRHFLALEINSHFMYIFRVFFVNNWRKVAYSYSSAANFQIKRLVII